MACLPGQKLRILLLIPSMRGPCVAATSDVEDVY
jgi:hypothetical protein